MLIIESVSTIAKIVAAIAVLFVAPAFSAELLVVEQSDCPYCKKFNAQIASAYPNTTEGKRAPLVRVQLNEDWAKDYSLTNTVSVTPTFILVENGQEVDRIVGYPGDDYFWFLLNGLLDKLP